MSKAIDDGSNGYEAVADIYIAGRGTRSRVGDSVGAAVVRAWADAFPSGASARSRFGSGCTEYTDPPRGRSQGVRHRRLTDDGRSIPQTVSGVPIERSTVEGSAFFNRTFDGVLAWGLLFLLDPAAQALVIEKVARALESQARFLFTRPGSPWNAWTA